MITSIWQQQFLHEHRLDEEYLETTRQWFDDLAQGIARRRQGQNSPLVVGVNGCQGSGKTTLVAYLKAFLANEFGMTSATLSLDDCYHTLETRQSLARDVHPLLLTRGVPGTHDVDLLNRTLSKMLESVPGNVGLPRFDKAMDDRADPSTWDKVATPIDIVLLEGWCLGVVPEDDATLKTSVNALEDDEDQQLTWRRYVNEAIKHEMVPLYQRIDYWVMLEAPDFSCVLGWRREQEEKLQQQTKVSNHKIMNEADLLRFVAHFERVTRLCLSHLPDKVHCLYRLDENRKIKDVENRGEAGF